jgi:hypothetical protein
MLGTVSFPEKEDFQKEFIKALTAAKDQKITKKIFIETYLWYRKK